MRIVFMGTPHFAVPCLRMLLESPWDVVAVVTQPDRPRGRGRSVQPSPIREVADQAGIRVETPVRLGDPESVQVLRDLRPDVIVVNAYAHKVPPEILALPPRGCINVHPSLLPKYRGGAPIRWTLFNGETCTGITTFYMAEGWDDGDMILREEIPVGENETYGELSARLSNLGEKVLHSTLELVARGEAARVPQNDDEATRAPILKPEDEVIDWSLEGKALHNRVRGLSPSPGAKSSWRGKIVKILRTEKVPVPGGAGPGEVVPVEGKKGLFVATKSGMLEILELQVEGKRPMTGRDFINGYRPEPGETFGGVS
jgi:methionyl-tRNA formyltransferase